MCSPLLLSLSSRQDVLRFENEMEHDVYERHAQPVVLGRFVCPTKAFLKCVIAAVSC